MSHKKEHVSTGNGYWVKNGSTLTQVISQDGKIIADVTAPAGSIGTAELADGAVSTAKLADGAVTYAKRSSVAAVTATDDGTTTGTIPAGTTFATITSAGATKVVKLPAAAAAGIGSTLDLYVGANGYELITATDAHTISTVDSNGTNQLDVAANSLLRLIQVSATGWFAYQVTATTITVVAPDND